MSRALTNYTSVRRVYDPHDPFFCDGNLECIYTNKTVEDDIDILIDTFDSVQLEEFQCHAKGCLKTFKNPLNFQRHFDMLHRFRCEECGRNFPSNYLLSLHLEENHDAFFKIQLERGLAVFNCILESCGEKFRSSDERCTHTIEAHNYPSNFRFNAVKRNHRKYQEKNSSKTKDIKSKTSTKVCVTQTDTCSMDVDKPKNVRKKKNRKNYKNEMELTDSDPIACAPISSPNMLSNKPACLKNKDIDMSSTNIANEIELKKQLPKSISFGRGVQKGFSRK